MGKVWQPGDAKAFARWAKKGVTVYTRMEMATNLAPYEDPYLYSAHTADDVSPITGNVLFGHMSAKALCTNFGPVYAEPPAGIRNVATPPPQVAGPVDAHTIHELDEAEIRGLEKRAIDAERQRQEHEKQQAKKRWSLFG